MVKMKRKMRLVKMQKGWLLKLIKKRSITNITLIFARAERPFGNLKVKFDVFDNPWAEDLTQLKYLVFYGVAVNNMIAEEENN